jgi:hypothetical protein
MLEEIVARYDQAPLWVRAGSWGLVVLSLGYAVGAVVHIFKPPWAWEQLAKSLIEATITVLAVATLLKNRDKRIRRRFQEIGYLNHHIRNALAVIEMAQSYVKKAEEREELVSSSSLRIQLCLQKVSRDEDLIDVSRIQKTSAFRHRRAS